MIITLSGGAAGGEQIERFDTEIGATFTYNGAKYRYDGEGFAVYIGEATA